MNCFFYLFLLSVIVTFNSIHSEDQTQTAKGEKVVKHILNEKAYVEYGDPVVVAISSIDEKRWGFHQFPLLGQLPDGSIELSYSNNEDAVTAYGTKCPTFISKDQGLTWVNFEQGTPTIVKPHAIICNVAPGEFLYAPPARPLDISVAGLTLPKANILTDKGQIELHRIEDCPKAIQEFCSEIDAYRWTGKTKTWTAEKIKYETKGAVVWKNAKGKEVNLVPRTWFEHPPVKLGDELIYADYRAKFLGADGKPDLFWTSTCMVSKDKGQSWSNRGTIHYGSNEGQAYEPMISPTSDGGLICVIRTSGGGGSEKLLTTHSKDAGKTWSKVKAINDYGVFPGVILLENGVLVVSYGRPGVHLKFSADGLGETWSNQISLIPSTGSSCGYTGLIAINENEFLIAYSDFKHIDNNKKTRKAILVRRVKVTVEK